MGVWIEIISAFVSRKNINVTPRAGVWIEIANTFTTDQVTKVTPRAGVWIEISNKGEDFRRVLGHSPCGSVD